MGDANPIRTLGDYSKPSHEGYRNTIELPAGNNVREEINDRIAEMLELLKELTTNMDPEKVLIREEAKSPVTKNMPLKEPRRRLKLKMEPKTNQSKELKEKKQQRHPALSPFNDSLSGIRVEKVKGKTYNLLPRGPVYETILRKKITRKENIGGNFEILGNIRGLKCMNALVDQGSDINVMPLSTYVKLTDERPTETDIRLSLASHSYIYPLGIAEDVLVDVAGYVYPVDFMILDIKEDEKRPFILGTPFLTMTKAVIKFNKETITLRSEKSKISFHRIPESLYKEKEMEFDQWRSKNFNNKHPALIKVEGGMDDDGEVTKSLIKNEEEIFTVPGDDVGIKTRRCRVSSNVIFDEKKLGSS
ncbi:zinc finger, CCHC-type containing protein [Tanacetum coccineum]